MKYCKYCGSEIPEDAAWCTRCGRQLRSPAAAPAQPAAAPAEGQKPSSAAAFARKPIVWIVAAVAVIVLVIVLAAGSSGRCHVSGCSNKAVSGSDYCYTHKCAVSSCNRQRLPYSNYCSAHAQLYDDDYSINTAYVAPSDQRISGVTLSKSGGGYTYAERILQMENVGDT